MEFGAQYYVFLLLLVPGLAALYAWASAGGESRWRGLSNSTRRNA